MKIEKRVHQIWNEKAHEIIGHLLVGKWQYLYSNEKGTISLVQLYGYPLIPGELLEKSYEHYQWEIYQIGGTTLFEDVDRFDTKEEAEKRISQHLDEEIPKEINEIL